MDHKTLERHIKKTTIVSNILSLIVALLTAMSVVYGFYYKTNTKLSIHTNDIKEIQQDVKDVKGEFNDIDIFKGVSTEKFEAMGSKVERMEKIIDKMDNKLDRILFQTRQ